MPVNHFNNHRDNFQAVIISELNIKMLSFFWLKRQAFEAFCSRSRFPLQKQFQAEKEPEKNF